MKEPTKYDVQYEKRVLMTAMILGELRDGEKSFQYMRSINIRYHNYAKNDALKYLIKHGYIESTGKGYKLSS